MINIAVCDDTSKDIELCSKLLSDYSAEHPELDVELSTYVKSDDLLFDIESGRLFDLFILDIIMPEINGIDLGKKIHEKYPDAALVYVTTSTDYAIEAFSVYAFQYLLKPIRSENFFSMQMFSYPFMVRALVAGTFISLCSALLGVSLVLKRYSMIGDGLSHGTNMIKKALLVPFLCIHQNTRIVRKHL